MAGEKWNTIEITNNNSKVLKDLEIDLTQDTDDEVQEEVQERGNNQRANVQANDRDNRVQADEEDEDGEAGTEVSESKEENAEERPQVRQQGDSRRARRIRNQQARIALLEQELARERQEKNQVAQGARSQNAKYMTDQKDFWDKRTDQLEEELAKAVEANDAKAQAKVQRALNEAQINQKVYSAAAQEYEQEQDDEPVQPQRMVQQPQQVAPPKAAVDWATRNNTWFNRDRALTMKTLEVNQEMLREGEYDPADPEYYKELEKRLEDEGINLKKLQGGTNQNQQQNQRRSPVGGSGDGEDAPAVRQAGKTGRTQFKKVGDKIEVTPTTDDYDMAERLNVPIKNFMKSKLLYEQNGGKGYTEINVGRR